MTARDPWHFQRWAHGQKVGNPTRKLILTALAMMAESSTGYGYASQDDLAEYAECSARMVRAHLKTLEESGLIVRRHEYRKGGGRLADGFMLLDGYATHWPDGQTIPAMRKPTSGMGEGIPEVATSAQQPSSSLELPLVGNEEKDNGLTTLRDRRENDREAAIDRIVEYWRQVMPGRSAARSTPKRREKVKARLATFPEATLLRAIDRAAADPWKNGANPNGKLYNDFSTIFQSDDYVDNLLAEAALHENGGPPPSAKDLKQRERADRRQRDLESIARLRGE